MSRKQVIWALVALAALALAPVVFPGYYLGLLTKSLILGLFAMSLNLLLGLCGLSTFGHALYFGVAAYSVAFVSLHFGITSLWLNLAIAVLLAGLLSIVLVPLTLRARGTYYGMITLAIAQVGWGIAHGWRSVTGGDDGLPGLKRPEVLGVSFAGEVSFYYLTLVVCGICAALIAVFIASPFGHALVGTRENETRMRVLGYNVWRYQYAASIIATLFAGVAGVMFAYFTGYVSPVYLSISMSAQTLLMVVLGGSTALFGPVLGALIIVLLDNLVSYVTERWLLVLGIVYVLVTLYAPRGLWPLLFRRRR